MKPKSSIPVSFLAIFLLGCAPKPDTASENTTTKKESSQTYLLGATLFTQQSAEYRALCFQAYHLAEMQLRTKISSKPTKAAIVFDIDETLLDNSPYTAWQISENKPYSPETWTDWVEMKKAEAVPGAVAFTQLADSLGYSIFYVSNRDTSHLLPTIENMRLLGFPQLQAGNFMLRTNTSDKSARRENIGDMGFTIEMYVGDNLGDFSGIWDKPANTDLRRARVDSAFAEMGSTFIALPNTLYGTWEGALYGYRRDFSDEQLDSIRRSKILPL